MPGDSSVSVTRRVNSRGTEEVRLPGVVGGEKVRKSCLC